MQFPRIPTDFVEMCVPALANMLMKIYPNYGQNVKLFRRKWRKRLQTFLVKEALKSDNASIYFYSSSYFSRRISNKSAFE